MGRKEGTENRTKAVSVKGKEIYPRGKGKAGRIDDCTEGV